MPKQALARPGMGDNDAVLGKVAEPARVGLGRVRDRQCGIGREERLGDEELELRLSLRLVGKGDDQRRQIVQNAELDGERSLAGAGGGPEPDGVVGDRGQRDNATTLPDPGAPTAQVLVLRPVEPGRREQFSAVSEESNSGTSSGEGKADSRRVAADSREILVGKRLRSPRRRSGPEPEVSCSVASRQSLASCSS